MKKIWVILLSIVLVFCFSACSNKKEQILEQHQWVYCGEIKAPGEDFYIYYDTKTKVMYAKGYCTLTVLLNADGTPMLYEGEEMAGKN